MNPSTTKYPSNSNITHPITFEEHSLINNFDNILKDLDKKVEDLKTNFELAAKKVQLAILQAIIRHCHITGIPVPPSISHSTAEITRELTHNQCYRRHHVPYIIGQQVL